MSTLFFRFFLPGKWPVCCIGSNITSLCGVIRFATCLTERMNSFWLRFSSVTVFEVVVVIIIGVVVWDIVIGVTVFVSRTILIIFSFFSVFFQQATLISLMPYFPQWWLVGLDLSALEFVRCWLTVFICSSSGASKPFSSNSLSRCVTICSYVPFSRWA